MKITLQNVLLLPVSMAMVRVTELEPPARATTRFQRNLGHVNTLLEPVNEAQKKAREKYGGEVAQHADGTATWLRPPEAMEELRPMLEDEVEVEVYPVAFEDVAELRIRPADLALLQELGIVTPDPTMPAATNGDGP